MTGTGILELKPKTWAGKHCPLGSLLRRLQGRALIKPTCDQQGWRQGDQLEGGLPWHGVSVLGPGVRPCSWVTEGSVWTCSLPPWRTLATLVPETASKTAVYTTCGPRTEDSRRQWGNSRLRRALGRA